MTQLTLMEEQQNAFGVVLVEPRIPQNVGNIGRLCACTGSRLILIGDLGFNFDDKFVKRSGMDYLEHVTPERYPDLPDLVAAHPDWDVSFYSTKATRIYTETPFKPKHFLVFGREDKGLPEAIMQKYSDKSFRIPMLEGRRSLNIGSSVAVVVYEGLRQLGAWPAAN